MMTTSPPLPLDSDAVEFYHTVLEELARANVPFLVGGAYALYHHTGIVRNTKDLDVFVRPRDAPRAVAAMNQAGHHAEITFAHWLGKVFSGAHFIDIIFSSGNGLCSVDDEWFTAATPAEVLGMTVPVCPVEEMIWQKAFIQERERFDGADVNHLLRACGARLDWPRLLRRFGAHGRVLLSHLILFGYVYPGEQHLVPRGVLGSLMAGLLAEGPARDEQLCRGTLLSREQYLIDIEAWGLTDARLPPGGRMTPEEVLHWTAGIDHP
jgi:hypothetical protein